MFKNDTFNPMRILEAVKRWNKRLGEKGEVAVTDPPAAPPTDWKASLPDDIKADPIFTKYKEPADAFKALVEAQKFLGREKLPVPQDANDKATYDLIFKKLGLPENEKGYTLPTDFEIPKELPFDENLLNDFRKTAHSLGVLPKQFEGLYKWYMTSMVSAYNKMGEDKKISSDEAENLLRKKWGAAYQQNMNLAEKVFSNFADEKVFDEFDKSFGNNTVLIELFANIGKTMSEDQLIGKPHSITLTPQEAEIEINKIKSDMNHPYWKNSAPGHKEAVERMTYLTQLVTAGG